MQVIFTQAAKQNSFTNDDTATLTGTAAVYMSISCTPGLAHHSCLHSKSVLQAAALRMHCKVCLWLSRSHVCITKGVSSPCLDYFNLPVNLPNCSLWIYNLQIHNHNLQEQGCLWLVKMTIIHHLQVVTAHNLMLHYNQMLSNLQHRCQGKGIAEARGLGRAEASPARGHEKQLLAAPGHHCRPDPATLRDSAAPLTNLSLCKAALLTSCYTSLPAHREHTCLGKNPTIWHSALLTTRLGCRTCLGLLCSSSKEVRDLRSLSAGSFTYWG